LFPGFFLPFTFFSRFYFVYMNLFALYAQVSKAATCVSGIVDGLLFNFCRSCAPVHCTHKSTRIFRLFNTQNGALCAPRPALRNFADPSGEINNTYRKPREKSLSGKKSAKVFRFSYSQTM
jgi:hypothetical protein